MQVKLSKNAKRKARRYAPQVEGVTVQSSFPFARLHGKVKDWSNMSRGAKAKHGM